MRKFSQKKSRAQTANIKTKQGNSSYHARITTQASQAKFMSSQAFTKDKAYTSDIHDSATYKEKSQEAIEDGAIESDEEDLTSSDQTSKVDTDNMNETFAPESQLDYHNIYAGGNSITSFANVSFKSSVRRKRNIKEVVIKYKLPFNLSDMPKV